MKKLMTVLAIMLAVSLNSFGQNSIGSFEVQLFDGETITTDLTLSVNSTLPNKPNDGGTMIILFDNLIDFTNLEGDVVVDGVIQELTALNGATYGVKFEYAEYGVIGLITVHYDPNTIFSSVYDEGFNAGVLSVDTTTIYNNGVASVPECVQDFTQSEVDDIEDAAYDLGLSNGADLTTDADDYAAGFDAGKQTDCSSSSIAITSSDMGVSVYPNPVVIGSDINIDCANYAKVDVLTITGQTVKTLTSDNVPTSDLLQGVYFLNVWDTDGNVSATKVLVQ